MLLILTILTSVVVLSVAQDSLGCDNNWIHHGDSCYHFSHDKENWFDAMEACKLFGSYLVEIDDQLENNFVINNMKYNYSWIGLSDLLEEGVWQWMTSKTTLETSSYWAPGEPNNSGLNENCALAYRAGLRHGWNDGACSGVIHYVCEKPSGSDAVIG